MDERVPEPTDSHASSSHEVSLEPTFEKREDLGKHSVILISLKTEIARSICFRDRIWPNRIWPELVFFVFWPNVCVCVCVSVCVCVCVALGCLQLCVVCVVCVVCSRFWWVSSRFLVGVFKTFGPLRWTSLPLRGAPPPADRPSAGPPLRRTAQNFALCFLSPARNFILSSLSGGSSR